MTVSVGFLVYVGVMPLIKTCVVSGCPVSFAACFDSLQVRRTLVRIRSCEDGHVSSGCVARSVHCQHEYRTTCAHLREHCSVFHAFERISTGSYVSHCVCVSVDRVFHGHGNPRGMLCSEELLARHRRYDRNEQLGKPSSVQHLSCIVPEPH